MSSAEFLYILSHPDGLRKIGRSKSPRRRIGQHQRHSNDPLQGEAVFPCRDSVEAERVALTRLSQYRIFGEWFRVEKSEAINVLSEITRSPPLPFPPNNAKNTKRLSAPPSSRSSQIDAIWERAIAAMQERHSREMTLTEVCDQLGLNDIDIWIDALPRQRQGISAHQRKRMQELFLKMAASRRRNGAPR